jgi:hypothetical protein
MSIRERLQLVFRRADAGAQASADPQVPFAPTTDLEVVAYAEDCRLFGHLALSAARLTDMLNDAEEIELVDVAAEALTDGRVVEIRSIVVRRDELFAVEVSGPRGAREHRLRTRPHAVAVKSGPYIVRGQMHASPTVDPFAAFRRRPPMVPLTEGSISYAVADAIVVRHADTVIVNRDLMDWVTPVTDAHDESPALPPLPAAKGILLKDFTGGIHPLPHDDEVDPAPITVTAEVDPAPITVAAEVDVEPAVDGRSDRDVDADADAGSVVPAVPVAPVRRPRKALRRAG